jgi:hypothetical protein
MHLYSNNQTPTVNDTLVDYTEVNVVDYFPQAVTGWLTDFSSDVASTTSGIIQFDVGDTSIVYGYYLTDSSNNILYGAELFPSPYSFPSGGATLSVQIQIDLGN